MFWSITSQLFGEDNLHVHLHFRPLLHQRIFYHGITNHTMHPNIAGGVDESLLQKRSANHEESYNCLYKTDKMPGNLGCTGHYS